MAKAAKTAIKKDTKLAAEAKNYRARPRGLWPAQG